MTILRWLRSLFSRRRDRRPETSSTDAADAAALIAALRRLGDRPAGYFEALHLGVQAGNEILIRTALREWDEAVARPGLEPVQTVWRQRPTGVDPVDTGRWWLTRLQLMKVERDRRDRLVVAREEQLSYAIDGDTTMGATVLVHRPAWFVDGVVVDRGIAVAGPVEPTEGA